MHIKIHLTENLLEIATIVNKQQEENGLNLWRFFLRLAGLCFLQNGLFYQQYDKC
jgi:hypothetical protein